MNDTTEQDPHPTTDEGRLVRFAELVGDFSSPFYRDERQRDVWNEASAVALQVALWLGTAAVTAMVWLGGATALPYALGSFLTLGASSWFAIAYARRLGVRADDPAWFAARRTVPYVLLVLLLVVGVLRAAAQAGGFGTGVAYGMAGGATVAVLVLVVASLRSRRALS